MISKHPLTVPHPFGSFFLFSVTTIDEGFISEPVRTLMSRASKMQVCPVCGEEMKTGRQRGHVG